MATIKRTHDDLPINGQWLLEGGDDRWEELAEAIRSCLDEVIAGGVLEVISWSPGIEHHASPWCATTGHELLGVVRDGASTRFWIKKREATPERAPSDTGNGD